MLSDFDYSPPEPVESRLLKWLEMVKLEIEDTDSGASNNERVNSVSKWRRRIEEACQRRENSKKRKNRIADPSISRENVDTNQAGASSSAVTDQYLPGMW